MNNRYLISLAVSKSISDSLNQIHSDLLHQPTQINYLHLSILHPFFLNQISEDSLIQKIKNVQFTPFTINLEKLDFFGQSGKLILYIHAFPKDKLTDLHQNVTTLLGKSITTDTSPFEYREAPEFLPHISLNYDFPDDPKLIAAAKNFSVSIALPTEKLELAKEFSPGTWARLSPI